MVKSKKKKVKKKQAQRWAGADQSGTKVTGEFSTNGHIFSPNAQNGFLQG